MKPVAGSSRLQQNYTNYGQHASKRGHISNTTIINQPSSPTVFDLLHPDFVQDALYNSAQRWSEHAVTCQPETRDKILGQVRAWADSTTPLVCWLSGPAGTGKTTVAHTIAKEYDERGQLAAAFFCWRKTGDRDNINKIVSTLAYQIAEKISSAKERMEENLIPRNASHVPLMNPPSQLSLEDQLSKLLITIVNPSDPNLIIIDGLDECASRKGICQLIEWIRINKPPFRFLLTSRPEPEIKHHIICSLGDGQSDVRTLSLTESIEDVRKYFVEHLEKVWPKQQRTEIGGPLQWPSESYLNTLVEKSEGLFVYAATAVRYIGGEGSPQKRLKHILNLHEGVDYLYAQVIEEAMKGDYFDIVMGSITYLRDQLDINDLSRILLALDENLTSPGIRLALRRCHSILVIPNDNSPIEFYHASLRDFLIDQSRSGTLFNTPAACHGRLLFGCLSAITKASSDAPPYALTWWYYHACYFLSTDGVIEGLENLKDETQELSEKIDLNWVKSWMTQALDGTGMPHWRGDALTRVRKDRVDKYWTKGLEAKLRSIDVILKHFTTYAEKSVPPDRRFYYDTARPQNVRGWVRGGIFDYSNGGIIYAGPQSIKFIIDKFFRSQRVELNPQIVQLEGSVLLAR